MVSLLDWLFPMDVTNPSQQAPASSSQKARGTNIHEVSYQEGSKDKISHTKSSGFHFIEIHQGTVGTMLIFFMVLGVLLCCLKAARSHFIRRQHFRATVEWKIRERMQQVTDQDPENPPYIWDTTATTLPHRHLSLGQTSVRTLHGSRYPTVTYSQEDLLRNLRENIERQMSRSGSRRHSNQNYPTPHPSGTAHRRSSTWKRSDQTAETDSFLNELPTVPMFFFISNASLGCRENCIERD